MVVDLVGTLGGTEQYYTLLNQTISMHLDVKGHVYNLNISYYVCKHCVNYTYLLCLFNNNKKQLKILYNNKYVL